VNVLPYGKFTSGGLLHLSEIMSPKPSPASNLSDEASAAVEEALHIFQIARSALHRASMTPQDVIYVHLYLSKIAHFALINQHYRAFFGAELPPSRSCVAIGEGVLPGNRRVLLDLCAQKSSGKAMRSNDGGTKQLLYSSGNLLREVLHVQGISYWAPVCVGPYSQANTVRGGMTMLAGQIGLDPPTMTLVSCGDKNRVESCKAQLRQAWRNAAAVLDAQSNVTLDHCLGALVYVNSDVMMPSNDDNNDAPQHLLLWNEVEDISAEAVAQNGGILSGFADGQGIHSNDSGEGEFDGYEDEETAMEMQKQRAAAVDMDDGNDGKPKIPIPILIVAIPEMPVGALSEVELVCVTRKAFKGVGVATVELELSKVSSDLSSKSLIQLGSAQMGGSISWDCGYIYCDDDDDDDDDDDYDCAKLKSGEQEQPCYCNVEINGSVRFVKGCCAVAWIKALLLSHDGGDNDEQDTQDTTGIMELELIFPELLKKVKNAAHVAGMTPDDALHIRLYYNLSHLNDDGVRLRSAFNAAIASNFSKVAPACSIIPVVMEGDVVFATQCIVCNLVHMESEMWARYGRNND